MRSTRLLLVVLFYHATPCFFFLLNFNAYKCLRVDWSLSSIQHNKFLAGSLSLKSQLLDTAYHTTFNSLSSNLFVPPMYPEAPVSVATLRLLSLPRLFLDSLFYFPPFCTPEGVWCISVEKRLQKTVLVSISRMGCKCAVPDFIPL